ncbi:WD40-repeat-containing domain protein [Lobosporangium transversale]|uniref:WD40-repeat-containing domain protein n=1 Tax=Lobosporangium transversale TaxID=64571 RepID=A0A1Y2G9N5_9FUNG|nr:WD40-repeat-containing domain protein [Lobosporangium transversale]ORZ04080.1 WD40-repeat-containing domain protein [Lobosporangium transversale]|eukprot:XP_021876357.1 WD40-repeat-containing domain protein [Lobosporangium transversale]
MRVKPLQIHWHDKQPIYSAHFELGPKGRLATAGGDGNVRLWRVVKDKEKDSIHVEFLSSLNRHTAAVNVVRFSPTAECLASAGDDGNIILWRPTDTKDTASRFGESDDDEYEHETWRVQSMMRGSLSDIYDLAWSPDGRYIISGSIDNTARIWDVKDAKCIHVIADHHHYVQGVAWDPLGEFVATQSSDRSVHIYAFKIEKNGNVSVNNLGKSTKLDLVKLRSIPQPPATTTTASPVPRNKDTVNKVDAATDSVGEKDDTASRPTRSIPKTFKLYHDETLTSFFRRLTFTPDGSMLLTPAGLYKAPVNRPATTKDDDASPTTQVPELETKNTVYVYARRDLSKGPVAHLPGQKKPSVAIRCSPVLYELRQQLLPPSQGSAYSRRPANLVNSTTSSTQDKQGLALPPSVFGLRYRSIYAVATQDTILIYDTQQTTPLAFISHIHYATFTDMAWSTDGCDLILTSSDGFCSIISFEEGELGTIYTPPKSMMPFLSLGGDTPLTLNDINDTAATIAASAGMLQKLNGLSLAEHREQMDQKDQKDQKEQKDQKDQQKAKAKQEKVLNSGKRASVKQMFSKSRSATSSQSSAAPSNPPTLSTTAATTTTTPSTSCSLSSIASPPNLVAKTATKTERDGDLIMTPANEQPAPKKRRIQPTFISPLPGSVPPATVAQASTTIPFDSANASISNSTNSNGMDKPKKRIQPIFVSALPGH